MGQSEKQRIHVAVRGVEVRRDAQIAAAFRDDHVRVIQAGDPGPGGQPRGDQADDLADVTGVADRPEPEGLGLVADACRQGGRPFGDGLVSYRAAQLCCGAECVYAGQIRGADGQVARGGMLAWPSSVGSSVSLTGALMIRKAMPNPASIHL